MGLKFDEVIGTYLLLGCNRLELEGWTVTVRLLPSADPTNSCSSSPSCKLQYGISANPKQQSFSNPGSSRVVISTLPEKICSLGRTGSQGGRPAAQPKSACQFFSQPGDEDHPATSPPRVALEPPLHPHTSNNDGAPHGNTSRGWRVG